MKKLLIYLKNYKKESFLGPLFKLLEASLELCVPLVMANIIKIGIAQSDNGHIVGMSLLLVLLGAVGLAFSLTAQYFAAKASVGFAANVRHALFAHIGTLSYTELDTLGTSTLITRMTSDVNQMQSGLNLTLRLLLRSPFVVFGAMIMAFSIDGKIGLIFAVVIPILCVIVFGIMLASIPLYKKVQQGLDRVLRRTRENLSGARVLRAFCKEEEEVAQFSADNAALTARQTFVGRIAALMNPVTFVVINLAMLILIKTGSLQVSLGNLEQGDVVALYNYMALILTELVKMANLIITINKSLASANRVAAAMETKSSQSFPVDSPSPSPNAPAVEFRGVSLRYAGAGEDSLRHVNLSVARGETVGVIGGTGSGKTTLINLIPRFYDATAGEVLVNGVNVKNYPANDLRQRIGIVPQKAILFHGSIRDNLQWGKPNATDEELHTALETAQAMQVVTGKPGGLSYTLEQNGRNLSGGQKQRLTIARALVGKPEILILDDSASALDFATDANLRRALREIPGAPTVFIVSQRTSSIRFADQIVVLDDGDVVGIGRHEDLLENCPVYKEIYDSQFRKEDVPNA